MWAAVLLIPLVMFGAFAVMSLTSQRPESLGVRDGLLAPCPDSPNCVSTQADRELYRMDAIRLTIDSDEAIAVLKQVVLRMARSRIVTADDRYLHVEFTSRLFRFVDDVEFFVDHERGMIHFRSASRSGHSDLGVNRRRMQAIVADFQREVSRQAGSPKTDR